MQITEVDTTTYHNPVSQVPVPAQFREGNFKVSFSKLPQENPKSKRKLNPALNGLGIMHDDLIAPTTDIEDWELD